jgi:hypothetical protein
MVNFSKGPWECVAAEFGEGENEGLVAFWVRMPEPCLCKADANLIAAAPDMREALTKLQWYDDGWCLVCGHSPKEGHQRDCFIGAAIAKADGDAQ